MLSLGGGAGYWFMPDELACQGPYEWSPFTKSTDAAGAYVGLTRGRHTNTAHFVADTVDQARDQWIEASGRNRVDPGLDQARNAASTKRGTTARHPYP